MNLAEINLSFSAGRVFLRHERFLRLLTGLGDDLRTTDPDIVTHRRIRHILNAVFIGQTIANPCRSVALLAGRIQIGPQHRINRRFERAQFRRLPHRCLPPRRLRIRQRVPDRIPANLVLTSKRPNTQTLDPGVPTYLGEQLHTTSHPEPSDSEPIIDTPTVEGGPESNRHNTPV
ncbi:hypothetical protein IWGMT90018_37550 [Mycobacterium kiyosense]|nr:hypothetical protein IWGMT90018_37550 [Mycobacterium kiyosense]